MDPSKEYTLLDDIGKNFLDHAVELVKSSHKFVFVLVNSDWGERAHDMRQDNQNRSVHAMAISIVFNRISGDHLPNSGPQKDLAKCNVYDVVVINDEELASIRR